MSKQKTRFYYGIIFLFVLTLFSICKSLYIKNTNNIEDSKPVYKEENQFNDN